MIQQDSGISIIDVMVVIALIAILSAIAVPNYIGWLPKYRLSTSARDVLSDLEYARATAIKVNAGVIVEFDTVNNTYRLWIDNGALTNKDNWVKDGDERTLRSRSTAPGISLTAANFSGSPRVRFTGNGIPEVQTVPPSLGGGNITLANKISSRTVSLSFGGKARIE